MFQFGNAMFELAGQVVTWHLWLGQVGILAFSSCKMALPS